MMCDKEFIVAEISKNWRNGLEDIPSGLLCQRFENVIEVNLDRGYRLHSFTLHRAFTPDLQGLNETIIAVFQRQKEALG